MYKINIVQVIVIIIFVVSFLLILNIKNNDIAITGSGAKCNLIKDGSDKNTDIVFLPYGYKDNQRFFEDVDTYVNGEFGFKNTEPFKSHFDQLNFYTVETADVTCDVLDDTIICNELESKIAAANCPNDYIIVLYDRDMVKDFIVPLRSSAYLNLASINTADHRLVVLHEFAHIFGGLADEYVEESISMNIDRFENCDVENCPRWSYLNNTGCFKGCGEIDFYRSIDNGIMRNYIIGREFGVWNEYLLSRLF